MFKKLYLHQFYQWYDDPLSKQAFAALFATKIVTLVDPATSAHWVVDNVMLHGHLCTVFNVATVERRQ